MVMKNLVSKPIPTLSYEKFVEICNEKMKDLRKEDWTVLEEERPQYKATNYLVFFVKWRYEDESTVFHGYYYLDFATNTVLEQVYDLSEYMDLIKLALALQDYAKEEENIEY